MLVFLTRVYLKDPKSLGPYSVITNNCEHFTTRCKTGKALSAQIASRNIAKEDAMMVHGEEKFGKVLSKLKSVS